MKRRAITWLLVCCLLISAFSVSSLAVTVGESVSEPHTITVGGTLESYSVTPEYSGGINASLQQIDASTLSLSLYGTAEESGTHTFTVSYTYEVIGEDGTPIINENGSPLTETGQKSYTLNIEEAAQPTDETPVITSVSPSSNSISMLTTDSSKTFSVSAEGNGELSYTWKLDSESIGNYGSSCTLTPSYLSVGTHYLSCDVCCGSSPAAEAYWSITVSQPAATTTFGITGYSSSAQITGTGTANFSVSANGTGLTYQWYAWDGSSRTTIWDGSAGSLIYGGTTTSTLRITCPQSVDSQTLQYVCVVRDAYGNSEMSSAYILYLVEDPEASKIIRLQLKSKPDRLEYIVGETLDTEGLVLTVTTAKGTEEVTEGFTCDPTMLDTVGTQMIKVTYGDKSTAFSVKVVETDHEHQWSSWVNDEELQVVYRICEYESCTARELYTYAEFVEAYPEGAVALGLITEDDLKADEETDTETLEADTAAEDTVENTNKNSGNAIYIIIMILAVFLLALVIWLYIRLYGKKKNNPQKTQNKNVTYRF